MHCFSLGTIHAEHASCFSVEWCPATLAGPHLFSWPCPQKGPALRYHVGLLLVALNQVDRSALRLLRLALVLPADLLALSLPLPEFR